MSNADVGSAAASGKPPSRPAPPVPTRRNIPCSPLPINSTAITVRKQRTPRQAKSEDETAKLVKMNEEILRYRTTLRDDFECNETNGKMETKNDEFIESDEIQALKKDLQDVLDKNARWQVYNDQREEYVRSLHEKCNSLQHQCQHMHGRIASLTNNPNQLSDEQRKYYDGLLIEARKELNVSREEASKWKKDLDETKARFSEEKLKLKRELEYWRDKYNKARIENMDLYKELESRKKRDLGRNFNKENVDEISLLKIEMEKYRKDFKLERQRREDIEHRLNGLQRKFSNSQISPHKKKSEHLMEYERDKPSSSTRTHYTAPNCSVSPPKVKKTSSDKSESRPHKERKSYPVKIEEHCFKPGKSHRERTARKSDNRTEKTKLKSRLNQTYSEFGHHDNEELQCPNCGKIYGVEEHEFLLIHIDSCV